MALNFVFFRSFILFFIPLISLSQTKEQLQGIVVHSVSYKPIEGAAVYWKGNTRGVVTGADGRFTLSHNPQGTLLISCIGFQTHSITSISDSEQVTILLVPLYAEQNAVTIVGSRGRPRTIIDRPVPVDVISAKDLEATGQVDLAQMAQFTSPSFVSAKTGLNGIANYADPASLKGMSPDQSLVLVNNKRRHQFAAISNTLVPGKGSVITDLNAIPALALERMEIMRDGAAAQYGSDAIAGIMNLILRSNPSGGVVRYEWGVTHKGDGVTNQVSLNKGWSLGKAGSFLNITFSYQSVSGTDRSDPYTGTIYSSNKVTDDSIRNARGIWPTNQPAYVMKYGSNQTGAFQSFLHFGYPVNDKWKWYGFGGTSHKRIVAYGFFRSAKNADPNASPLYPDGYSPLLPGKTADYSFLTGMERISNGWHMDFSTGFGYNHLDLYSKNSCNPSLGLQSPKNFYVGRNAFGQGNAEAHFSKSLKDVSFFKWMNIAFGTQLRYDRFTMREGDPASYAIGPLAATENKASGSSGRPGISLADRTRKSRTNIGSYIDLEADINKKWMVALAGRFEHYSDFGSNVSGKVAARLSLSDNMAIRGSVNRGFRAPSLQQIYNGQTTSNAQNGQIRQTKQLPADDSRLALLGVPFPGPELSWNYNFGFTLRSGSAFLFTADAYVIDVRNRIIISEVLPVIAAIPALQEVFPSNTGIKEVTFFTNHINTRTAGLDVVAAWNRQVSVACKIKFSLALNLNSTSITKRKSPPGRLMAGASEPVKLIDTISESLITMALPHQKVIASIVYAAKRFQCDLRITYFGKVTAWEKPSGLRHRSQVFKGKALCDLSAGYALSRQWKISGGVNNLFNVYPDRVDKSYASYNSGQVPYTRGALQFGFNGAFYFTSLQLQF